MVKPLDVTGDNKIVPGDSLWVINRINAAGSGPTDDVSGPPFYDTSGDDFIAPNDALLVINYINTFGPDRDSEGEAAALSVAEDADHWRLARGALAGWELLVLSAGLSDAGSAGSRRRAS
jgi:hypothetical protein